MSDQAALLAQAKQGNRSAFDQLIVQHRPSIYQHCFRLVSDSEDAEELTQKTLLRAWLKLPTCRADNERSFDAWLRAVGRNLCLRHLSARQIQTDHETPLQELAHTPPTPVPEVWLPNFQEEVTRQIDALPDKWREVMLRVLEGHSREDISRSLGHDRGYVDVLLGRARGRLQERLGEWLDSNSQSSQPLAGKPQATPDERREAAWREVEHQLRGLVVDYRLVTVRVGEFESTLQLWVPVLDVSRQRRFERRMKALKNRTTRNSQDAEAWRDLAESYRASGDWEQATDAYRKCVDLDEAVLPLTRLGLCLWKLERRQEACGIFSRAFAAAADPGEREMLQGHVHAVGSELTQAVQCYNLALSHSSSLPFTHSLDLRHRLAACHRTLGRPDFAAQQYEAILEVDPEDATAHNLVADCYRELGDWNKTVAALERAVEIVPGSAATLHHLAQKLVDTGWQMDRALGLAERAAHLAPGSWFCWKTLGQIYHQMGRLEEADLAYQKSVSVSSCTAESHFHYGAFLMDLGDYARALTVLNEACLLDPEHVGYPLAIAYTLKLQGDLISSWQWVERIARRGLTSPKRPTRWDHCWVLSGFLRSHGRRREAVTWARKSTRLNPASPKAWFELGESCAAAEKWEQALTAYENGYNLLPSRGTLHLGQELYLGMGTCCQRLGQKARARKLFREGVRAMKAWLQAGHTDPTFDYWVAQLYEALGETKSARAAAHRALTHPRTPHHYRREMQQLLHRLSKAAKRKQQPSGS